MATWAGSVTCRKSAQAPVPNASTLGRPMPATVSPAAAKALQCCPANKATGTSTPNCGFTAISPSSTPASTGRRSRSSTPIVISAAMIAPNCPHGRVSARAGEVTAIRTASLVARKPRVATSSAVVTGPPAAATRVLSHRVGDERQHRGRQERDRAGRRRSGAHGARQTRRARPP